MTKATDIAYAAIRSAILNGTFQPGDRLKEEKLVTLCGVSRTPIREAIQKLALENYLVNKPNFGCHVANWSSREIEDIFTLRAAIEGMATRRAADNITDEQLAQLQVHHNHINEQLKTSGPMDIDGFLQDNTDFHTIILNATHSEPLIQAAKRLISPPMVIRTAYNYSREDITRGNAHHLELIDALRAGDGEWGEASMRAHIKSAHHRFLAASK